MFSGSGILETSFDCIEDIQQLAQDKNDFSCQISPADIMMTSDVIDVDDILDDCEDDGTDVEKPDTIKTADMSLDPIFDDLQNIVKLENKMR